MQLSVKPYYQYRPASQWAFHVDFSDIFLLNSAGELVPSDTFTQEELNRLSSAVVSITQPKYKIEADTKCYGNFDFTVPKYDTNDLQMTVTFEETDDLLISHKFIGSLMGNVKNSDSPAWLNVHPRIFIGISRYNTYLHDIERQSFVQYGAINSINGKQIFCCQMANYTEPTYERIADSPSAATCTITFLLTRQDVVRNNDDYVDSIVTPSKITTQNTLESLEKAMKEIPFVAEELLRTGSVYVAGTVLGQIDLATLRRSNSNGRAATYLNQNITDDMIKQSFQQSVFQQQTGANGVINSMHAYFGEYGLDTTKQQQYRSNLMALSWAVNNANQMLKSQGIELKINSVNTGDHRESSSQKSHTYGSKADLAVFVNNKRVYVEDWSNDAALREKVTNALNTSGLHFQAETDTPQYGNQLWLDSFLWYGYNRNGQYIESYTPGGATNWGLKNDHFESSTGQHLGWAK